MRRLTARTGLPFLLHRGPGALNGEHAPLLVFLHGSGERGDTVESLDRLLAHSLPWVVAHDRLPSEASTFLIACPQTSQKMWRHEAPRVIDLIDEVCRGHGANPARCCLSGVSMGAGGCWDVAAAAPAHVAAFAPISGRVRIVPQTRARPPIWLFHGAHDDVNPAIQAVERLREGRANEAVTRVEIDSAAGHDPVLWTSIYTRGDLYSWLLKHAGPYPLGQGLAERP
jgi:predicted peptidase